LAEQPELGKMDRKKIAALVGLAPMNFDSGHKRGYRKTKGGRADVRSVPYMSTLVATRYTPVIQREYNHLLSCGKLKKGRSHRLQAQVPDHPQRHDARQAAFPFCFHRLATSRIPTE